jgi:hypothetical protein
LFLYQVHEGTMGIARIKVPITAISRVEFFDDGAGSLWNILFAPNSVTGHTNSVYVIQVPEYIARLAAISATATHGTFEMDVSDTFVAIGGNIDKTTFIDGPCDYYA